MVSTTVNASSAALSKYDLENPARPAETVKEETLDVVFLTPSENLIETIRIEAGSNRTYTYRSNAPAEVAYLDEQKLVYPLTLRRWQEGDSFIPFGMMGRKKVSDIFSDQKYTSVQKDSAVMIVDCKGDLAELQHIAGIMGLRMDDRYKITSKTETIIRITIL